MKVQLGQRRSVLHHVTLGEDKFHVEITPPSFADRLADNELLSLRSKEDGSWLLHRLKSTVTGWQALEDEKGNEIPFTWENFTALCEQYPEVYGQLIALVHEAYRPLEKDERKN